ncbi:hypothetical protein OS493_001932 [Desmophyllum pertusum]|uniref:STING ligand-binding domain-containing protein n=1 Tax=Desmophyllum pertusum TaxID=174260 RepID=A0A9W9Z815_9CNID|nr:hypothetical protein OS493_001932 [Desmophyllum pertusum]
MADQPRENAVAQQENNGFGPLSKPRGRAATIASVVVAVISGVVLLFAVRKKESREGILFLFFAVALLTISLVLGELVRRMCLITEEFQHQQTRYQGEWKNLLFLVGLRELSAVETSEINERKNKNVADGLAWSFYFGYLKFVLPELENQIGLSDQFRFKITEKKLFILLPKTCYTYDDIVDADSRVKFAGHLPEFKKSRGGIKERSYKHAVHRVEMPRPDGKIDEYHFVLEYATPLMSLYDMSKYAGLTAQERNHQVNCSSLQRYIFLLL